MEIENEVHNNLEPTQTYMYGETEVEVHGELNVTLFAEKLYYLFTKKGIKVFE